MDAHAHSPHPVVTDFLSLVEFAHLLGIGKTTAYELAQRNELPVPVLRVGRQYRVSRKAYDALLSAQHARNLDKAA
jgi:excisionase family DNA binding protein